MSNTTEFHKNLVDEDLHKIGYVQSSDPGAIGSGKAWVDISGGAGNWLLKLRNESDTAFEQLSKLDSKINPSLIPFSYSGFTATNLFDAVVEAFYSPIESVVWGDITGTLSEQEDLQAALDAKLNSPAGSNLDTETLTLSVGQIHSFKKVGNALFGGSRTTPPTITKIHDANNMVSGGTTVITLTGKQYCESVTYSQTTKKLYFLLVNEILELDPDTMAYTVFPISMTDGTGGSGAITTDGTYFYVAGHTLHTHVAKFSFDGNAFTNVAQTSILFSTLELGWGHSAEYDKDSGYLYVGGAQSPAWMAKIDPSTLSYSVIRLPGGYEAISDDIAVAPDYVYGVLEGPTQYRIIKVKKSDWSYTLLDPGIIASGFGCIYNPYNKNIYIAYNTTPGSYLKISQETGEMRQFTAPSGNNLLNELQFSEYSMWYTTWTTPAKVIRVSNPNEQYVRILKADGTFGYSYNEGDVVADSFTGDGSGLTNIAVGNDGGLQYKNGSSFSSSAKLSYDDTTNALTAGNLKFLVSGDKVGVYKYA